MSDLDAEILRFSPQAMALKEEIAVLCAIAEAKGMSAVEMVLVAWSLLSFLKSEHPEALEEIARMKPGAP